MLELLLLNQHAHPMVLEHITVKTRAAMKLEMKSLLEAIFGVMQSLATLQAQNILLLPNIIAHVVINPPCVGMLLIMM